MSVPLGFRLPLFPLPHLLDAVCSRGEHSFLPGPGAGAQYVAPASLMATKTKLLVPQIRHWPDFFFFFIIIFKWQLPANFQYLMYHET